LILNYVYLYFITNPINKNQFKNIMNSILSKNDCRKPLEASKEVIDCNG